MWWISRFKVSKLMKRPQQRLRIARNSLYEIYETLIYEKISKKSYCVVSLLWVIVCQLEKKEANLLIWTSTHFCTSLLTNSPLFTKAPKPQLRCLWIVYIANLSLSWISDTGLFALLLFLTEKSIFRLWLKGWKQSTALPVEHFQLSNFIRFGELLGQLGWKLDMPKTVYFLEALQRLQILSSITRYHMSY